MNFPEATSIDIIFYLVKKDDTASNSAILRLLLDKEYKNFNILDSTIKIFPGKNFYFLIIKTLKNFTIKLQHNKIGYKVVPLSSPRRIYVRLTSRPLSPARAARISPSFSFLCPSTVSLASFIDLCPSSSFPFESNHPPSPSHQQGVPNQSFVLGTLLPSAK